MIEQRFRYMIYELLDVMKNGTLDKLLAFYEQYQHVAWDSENFYYSLNLYLAGVLDASKIYREFGVDLLADLVK